MAINLFFVKKLISIALLATFFSVNSTLPTFAVAKAGTPCSKMGLTNVVGNKKFTCIKSGKKLIWDKGTEIKQPTSQKTPTSTSPSTNTDSTIQTKPEVTQPSIAYRKEGQSCISGSGDIIGYDKNNHFVHLMCNDFDSRYITRPKSMGAFEIDPLTGKQLSGSTPLSFEPSSIIQTQRKTTYLSPKFFQPVSIDNLIPSEVYGRSLQEIWNTISNTESSLDILNFNIAPNLDSQKVDVEKNTLLNTSKLWASIFKPDRKVEVILYDYPDLQWANDRFKSFTGRDTLFSAKSCQPTYCAAGSGNIIPNSPFIYEQGLGGGDDRNRSTSAHEFTHIVQMYGTTEAWRNSPLWLFEGMAQYYGEAVGYAPFDTNGETRKLMHFGNASNYKRDYGVDLKVEFEQKSDLITQKWMSKVEFPTDRFSQESAGLAYLLGSYATEVLVAVYGQQKVAQYVSEFKKTGNWEQTFQSTFGISKNDFYKKLTPYLYEMSKEL